MVRIVNWLLTRRCNLKCEYCGIVDNRKCSPFRGNEISTRKVIATLEKFQKYNPDIFHIFYGGEPFMRSDLIDILRFCNESNINYTVISNCTVEIQPKIREALDALGEIKSLSGSVDPSILMEYDETDSQRKSSSAFLFLTEMKNYINDVVAEVTMTKKNVEHTYNLIKLLTSAGIYTSLTAIDVNKSFMYDFSRYSSNDHLLRFSTKKVKKVFDDIMFDDTLLIHMKKEILPVLFLHINSTYDCELEKELHNLTIDSDGILRTCLRMKTYSRWRFVDPTSVIHVDSLFAENSNDIFLSAETYNTIRSNKMAFCKGCNHTCVMMSKFAENQSKIKNH